MSRRRTSPLIILLTCTFVSQGKAANTAQVAQTGQIVCYDASGIVISCMNTGQDGDIQQGVTLPIPRFTDNGNGTVTDNLTGLIWLKNANCFGIIDWDAALIEANSLEDGSCGLMDGSSSGDWRLPNIRELSSLIHYGFSAPALSNAAGTAKWTEGDPFSAMQSSLYWSSTTDVNSPGFPFHVNFVNGGALANGNSSSTLHVWPVRGGTNSSEIFSDSFESGDTTEWSLAASGS